MRRANRRQRARTLAGAPLALVALVALVALAGAAAPQTARAPGASARSAQAATDSARVPAGLGVPSAAVARVEGVPMVSSGELARLLGATRFWRSDVRKLVLRTGEHRLTIVADNPFVLVDDRTVRLSARALSRSGELLVPVEVVRWLPQQTGWPRLAYDADARQLRVAPSAGFVGAPRIETNDAVTRIVVPTEHAEAAAVVGRSRARFRLRLAGGLTGALPDSLPDDALVRDLVTYAAPGGVTFEIALDPAAQGWRLERDAAQGRVVLSFSRTAGALDEGFAAEGSPGPRVLRTLVIDPGHGGLDTGVEVEGQDEKALALELADLVADELMRRGGVHVVFTRHDDRDVTQQMRAELANRSRADAVLSLHFGAFADVRGRGTVAWCAPAVTGGGLQATARATGLIALLPWRDVAVERAVESRGLAEALTLALERRGFGPAAVHERLPLALIGVSSPGVLLECGALTNPEERARLLGPGGLRSLAGAIADGVLAWQRNE